LKLRLDRQTSSTISYCLALRFVRDFIAVINGCQAQGGAAKQIHAIQTLITMLMKGTLNQAKPDLGIRKWHMTQFELRFSLKNSCAGAAEGEFS